ncbi:hypothetical protein BGZ58_004794, partial [Dissophora ornata]
IHTVFHASLLEAYNANAIEGCTATAPLPIEAKGEIEYEDKAVAAPGEGIATNCTLYQ